MAQLNTRLVLRNDTIGNWTTADANSDLVLLKGEIGIEYDTNGDVRMKIGDGTTNWSALDYFGGNKEDIENITEVLKNIYTKSEVEAYVLSQLESAGHLKRTIVENLPSESSADVDTIYMLKKKGGLLVHDHYEEYMVINGAWELIGDTYVDLSNYATTTYVDSKAEALTQDIKNKADKSTTLAGYGITDAYTKTEVYTKNETENKIDEKIASVTGGESAADVKLALDSYRNAINTEIWGADAADWSQPDEEGKITYDPQYGKNSRIDKLEAIGAQANVLEAIKMVDESDALVIADKTVTLPAATTESYGVAKLSEEVGINSSGALEVKMVQANKLYQEANDWLILNGGSASLN